MLYTLTTTVDGETSSTVIDSSSPLEGSSVVDSSQVSVDETSSPANDETSSPSNTESKNETNTGTTSPDATPAGCFEGENLKTTLFGWGIFALLIAGYYLLNKRSMKKRQEYLERRNNIQPGNKVMTIGGITGTVVEVNPDDNTFVLETGSSELGKSYLRFDKAAIHTTDVEMEPAQPVVEETAIEEQEDELFSEENKPEIVEEPVAEETVEETTDEE